MSWLIVGGNSVAMALLGVLWCLAMSGFDGPLVPIVGGALLAGLAFANGCVTLTTGGLGRLRRRREQDTVLVVDASGIRMPVPTSDAGGSFLPWSLVGDIDRRSVSRHAVFAIKGRPVVRADHPGAPHPPSPTSTSTPRRTCRSRTPSTRFSTDSSTRSRRAPTGSPRRSRPRAGPWSRTGGVGTTGTGSCVPGWATATGCG